MDIGEATSSFKTQSSFESELQSEQRHTAAVRLQASQRGRSARKFALKQRSHKNDQEHRSAAALKLQALQRGRSTRKVSFQTRQDARQRNGFKLDTAATKLQASARGWRARRVANQQHTINGLLTNRADIDFVFSALPHAIKLKLTSQEFADECQEKFMDLDTDGNGVLTPDELFPIVGDLLGTYAWGVTPQQCQTLAQVLDLDGDGVISADEFLSYCQVVAFTSFVENMGQEDKFVSEGEEVVGNSVGDIVGATVGAAVGEAVGDMVGSEVGTAVGAAVDYVGQEMALEEEEEEEEEEDEDKVF